MATTEPHPIDPQAIYAEMARLARFLHPDAESSEWSIIRSDGRLSVIDVPMLDAIAKLTPEVAKVADAIVTVLMKLKPGESLSGPALAVQVEEETGDETKQNDGTFVRAVKHLKQLGKLPPNNQAGYRLNP